MGKSRLFWEFTRSHRTEGWLVLESASVSYGTATAYQPVIEMLRGYFQIAAGDDARRMREKITGKVLALDRALEPALPALLALLDVSPDDPAWEALAPPERRERTLEAVTRLLLRESRVQPLLVVFEDLHWIDAETQAVLDALVDGLPAARLLLLVNYRPEHRHGWGGRDSYRELRVAPLAPATAEALLDALVGSDPRLGALKRLLIERSLGNPFFLEESVQALVETGVLGGERGAYAPTRAVADVGVPRTVQALLAARIDRLPLEDKHLPQLAAAIGKEFPFVLLQAVAGLAEDALRARLARLEAGEFVYEAGLFPEPEYTFKHALTHEVAYQGLLVERRRELHARILDAMETLYADRLAEHVERLARHAQQAGRPERAVRYLRQAAAKAIARSANHEAVAFLQGALSALAELPETDERLDAALDVRLDLGPALIVTAGGTGPEVHAVYAQARARCERIGDSARLFQALWGLWYASLNRGQNREARELAERLLAAARDAGDGTLLLEAHHSLCATLFQLGELSEVGPHFDEAHRLYDPERHRGLAFRYAGHDAWVCARSHLGLALWALGYPDRAARCDEDARSLAGRLGHPPSAIIAHFMGAQLRGDRGEHDAAAARAQVVTDLASAHGQASYLDRATTLLEMLRAEPRPADDPRGRLAHALAAAGRGGWNWRDLWSLARLVSLCGRAGHVDEALAALAEVAAGIQSPNLYESELLRLEGELRERLPGADPADAHAAFRRATALARARGHKSFELRATIGLARLLARQGRREEGRRLLAEVYGWFTEGFETADLQTAKALLEALR